MGVVTLGAVSHRFNLIAVIINYIKIWPSIVITCNYEETGACGVSNEKIIEPRLGCHAKYELNSNLGFPFSPHHIITHIIGILYHNHISASDVDYFQSRQWRKLWVYRKAVERGPEKWTLSQEPDKGVTLIKLSKGSMLNYIKIVLM